MACAGKDDGYLAGLDLVWADGPGGRGPSGVAIRTGLPVVGHDFATDPILAPWREEAQQRGYRRSIGLPLVHEGQRIGVLTMYSADYGTGLKPPADWPYKTWLALIHTGDNQGPPKADEVVPRERAASWAADSSSMVTPRMPAERRTIAVSSSSV